WYRISQSFNKQFRLTMPLDYNYGFGFMLPYIFNCILGLLLIVIPTCYFIIKHNKNSNTTA
ncbi:MAG TPA: hypothetical protein VHS59_13440, partial [Bacillota bacterium]|nr:hypothetical protein [Bacillota bacterium]